jgi:Protein of unknown function (DUF1566)
MARHAAFRKMPSRSLLIALCTLVVIAGAQSSTKDQGQAKETQKRGYWIDPSTGLMWAGQDNGKDVSWRKAMKYCRDLRLTGYSDWRLPNMAELQGTYDKATDAPGLAGRHDDLETTWHVKGNLFLTGYQWSSNYRMDDRGQPIGYAYYFDFNSGKPDDDPGGYSQFKRALCVRGSGK